MLTSPACCGYAPAGPVPRPRPTRPCPGGHHEPGPGRPDHHRSGQRGPDRADAPSVQAAVRATSRRRTSSRPCSPRPKRCCRPGRTPSAATRGRSRPSKSSWSRRYGTAWPRCGTPIARCPGRPEGGQHARQASRPRPGVPVAQPQQGTLWRPEAHPLLFRRGPPGSRRADRSRHRALAGHAPHHHPHARRGHANTVTARDRLGAAYESAGRCGDAIAVFTSALADRERTLGAEHPDTLTARGPPGPRLRQRLAGRRGGRAVRAAGGRRRPPARRRDPVTLATRAEPGGGVPGRRPGPGGADRIPAAAGRLRTAARRGAPGHAGQPGQPGRRLPGQRAAQGRDRAVPAAGRGHRGGGRRTIRTRSCARHLASAYRHGGKPKDAIALYQRVLADRERIAAPSTRTRSRPGEPGLRPPRRRAATGGDRRLRASWPTGSR